MPEAIATARMTSPIGIICIAATHSQLTSIRIGGPGPVTRATGHDLLAEALRQFEAWFAGDRDSFELPLTPAESAEGERLRAGIAAIPYGTTATYGDVAARTESVARAVGQACKTNAFPIIIPCHRVTSASGPEYYSAGDGPRTKTWLIDFEYGNLPPELRTRLI